MTGPEVAALLERFAEKVIQLPGISRTRPHAFAEAKSELRGEMLGMARDLRAIALPPTPAVHVATIAPGRRTVGAREVRVERRARRA